MKLIVGLGNPGRDYKMTRHNLGFMLIDRLFARANGYRFREEASAEVAEVNLATERVLLAKPLTYMNLSGGAVRPLLEKYGGDPEVPDPAALARRFVYRDFPHFIETWTWMIGFLREYGARPACLAERARDKACSPTGRQNRTAS